MMIMMDLMELYSYDAMKSPIHLQKNKCNGLMNEFLEVAQLQISSFLW